MLLFALWTGMRQGDVLGLHWQAVRGNKVHARTQLQKVYRRDTTGTNVTYRITDLKRRSARTIAISPKVVELLERVHKEQEANKEHCRNNGLTYTDTDLDFTTRHGTHLTHRNTLRTHHRVLKKAGLPKMGFHSLRHTHATALLMNGTPPRVVQERLGHKSLRQTDHYTHVVPSMQDDVAANLDRYL